MAQKEGKVQLMSSDNQVFEVAQEAALMSGTVKNMIEEVGSDDQIPLPNVSGIILAKVIEYINYHVEADKKDEEDQFIMDEDDTRAWDVTYMQVDQQTLYELILAANYLNIKGLLDLTCQTVANLIKGRSTEDLRQKFNIKNDFTPEEEEEVKRENQWAFD